MYYKFYIFTEPQIVGENAKKKKKIFLLENLDDLMVIYNTYPPKIRF